MSDERLSAEEIARHRIMRKLKKRVVGMADHKKKLNKEREMIARLGVISNASDFRLGIRQYAAAGNARAVMKHRHEARTSQLAYCFIKGRPYLVVEQTCKTPPHWADIAGLLKHYCDEDWRVVSQRFAEWRDAGRREVVRPNVAMAC